MKKRLYRMVAVLVTILFLVSGCASAEGSLREYIESMEIAVPVTQIPTADYGQEDQPHFSEFRYERPDMQKIEDSLTHVCALAQREDADAVMEAVYDYYDEYDWFYTMYSLSDIYYSCDMSDSYWEEEYQFCIEQSATVDAGLEEIYYTLADSPCREALEGNDYFGPGFFDSYDGDNNWDDRFTTLLQKEAQLQNTYYSLLGESYGTIYGTEEYWQQYGYPMAQILADLVALRNEMAAHWGYDSYEDFAWDFYYYRDYSPREMKNYLEAVCRELVPLYRRLADSEVWDYAYAYANQDQTMEYVRDAAMSMGGQIEEAFSVMEARGLYDISYNENKYSTSFEVYLTSFQVPFLFLCPEREVYDRLTLAHEFGHFCNDYASGGSYAGVDVLEVFSQGMEYLSLLYGEEDPDLMRVKLADGLSTYVEQAAFATFEHRIYELDPQTLSPEVLAQVYETTALEFGFDAVGYEPMEFVTISHFYTNPLYIASYVVSNDAAIQFYQMELEKPGQGLKRFQATLDTEQTYFLSYLEEARLVSPFAKGQLESVRDMLRQQLFG